MGDHKSGSSSKVGESSSKSSKETPEHAQMSPTSHSNPATFSWTQSFGASDASSSSTKERRPSKDSPGETAVDDDENYEDDHHSETYESEEEQMVEPKATMTKRQSNPGRTNVYTECGRHGDDWLLKPITDAAKSVKNTVFGKNEKK